MAHWGGVSLTENVSFGPAARAIFGNISFRPPGGVSLTENVFMGHAARLLSPSGRCFLWACGPGYFLKGFFSPFGRGFFLGLRPTLFSPPGVLPPAGNFLLAQKVPQKRLPPVALRGLRLTRNPLGASLLRAHQRGSRGVVRNMEGVSTALCIQPRVFDTRLSNIHMPTLHYLMSTHGLTKSNVRLTLQQHYIAAC